jgi:DNA-binding beta-propeller fold protein YncE/photosystem II stability/assembly factor-like uncharacterized protein
MKKYGPQLLILCLLLWLWAEAVPAAASDPTPTLAIETIANLGVPAGNAETPRYLTLDEGDQRLFLLSEGHPTLDPGNKLSLFDLAQGQITQHLLLNHGDNQPLGLQFDPASGQLYALWQERYGSARPVLSVIDSHTMQVAQEIPNIEAFAVANGMLYMASAGQLSAVNLANNSLEQAQRLNVTPATATGPMAIDPAANRLYLARNLNGVWSVDIYEAGSLALLQSYPAAAQVRYLFPTAAGLDLITAQNSTYIFTRLTAGGELASLPAELGQFYGPTGMALAPDGQTLYYSNGQYVDPAAGTAPALVGLNPDSGAESLNLPLLNNIESLIIDSTGTMAYGVAPYDHRLYQLDLTRETTQLTNTVIQLRDVLVDAAHNRLFVSDSGNHIRQLDRETLAVLAETLPAGNAAADFGFKSATWSGELALDAARNRLYVSGRPTLILNAATLAEIDTLTPGGQVAVAPAGQNIYLSNCGVTVLNAAGLTGGVTIPGTTARPEGLSPNPCVDYSTLDAANQWLYSIVPNGVPGSNGGSYLYVYDVAAVQPTMIYSDTDITLTRAEPDPAGQRAFVGYLRNSNHRLRTLNMADGRYTHQLFGLGGEARYSAASRRLYLADTTQPRLLTLDADTLAVLAELPLPSNNYRLVEVDADRERLYLVDNEGRLLIAAPADAVAAPLPAAMADIDRPANGPIQTLAATAGPTFARIEAQFGDYSRQSRLYRTANPTAGWQDLSRNLPAQPLQTLAVSPNFAQDNTLLAGLLLSGQSGGLYKSTDGGGAWQPAMAGLRDVWVQQLFIAPDFERTGLLFAHTTYGGLHQSTAGGATWQPLVELDPNRSFPLSSNDFAVAIGPDSVLISQAINDRRGLYLAPRQADGSPGPWQPVLNLPAPVLGLSPDGHIALAFNTSLWRSADGGQSWQLGGSGLSGLENLSAASILFSPNFSSDQTVYLFFKDAGQSIQSRLFRSTDGGQNWRPWQLPGDSPSYTAFTLTPGGDILLGDAAAQLTQLAPNSVAWAASTLPTARFPVDDLAVSRDSTTLFASAGAYGVFKSTNGGKGWQPTAFPARTFGYTANRYRLALSPDFERDQTIFAVTGVSLNRSTDGGATWQALAPAQGEAFLAQRVALSPNFGQDGVLLAGAPAAIYRSTTGGASWTPALTIEGDPLGPDLLLFAPDGRTAYARFGYGRPLYRSDDGGQSWQPQSANRDEYFSFVAADTNAEGVLSGAVEFDRSLLQTGPQTPPWSHLTALPAELTGINAVAYYPPNGNLYVTGPGGMFFSPDNGQNWQPFPAAGLPGQPEFTVLKLSDTGLVGAMADGSIYRFMTGETGWKDISIIK